MSYFDLVASFKISRLLSPPLPLDLGFLFEKNPSAAERAAEHRERRRHLRAEVIGKPEEEAERCRGAEIPQIPNQRERVSALVIRSVT